MPIYEYECEKCQHKFETLVFKSDAEEQKPCPCCGSFETHKLISCTSFLGDSGLGACASTKPGRGFS